jgi:hypothetical protein
MIGLVLAIELPFARLGDLGRRYLGLGLWGGEVVWWGFFAVILAYVLVVERKGLSTFGYRTSDLRQMPFSSRPD